MRLGFRTGKTSRGDVDTASSPLAALLACSPHQVFFSFLQHRIPVTARGVGLMMKEDGAVLPPVSNNRIGARHARDGRSKISRC